MAYPTVKSVTKALCILEMLVERAAENKPLTLAEIAAATGILPVTARNLLRTLEERGYARRRGHGLYEEGPSCGQLFHSGGMLPRLREIAAPLIEQTVGDLGESLMLAAIINGRRVEVLRRQTADDPNREPEWYANAAFYQMRTTRVLLAWFSGEQLDYFITVNGLPAAEEWPAASSRETLKAELKKIRMAGGCCDVQGSLAAIAVPVLTPGGDIVAALGCYAPLVRTDKARSAGIFALLHECARTIQEQI